jgi:hypothetical protein
MSDTLDHDDDDEIPEQFEGPEGHDEEDPGDNDG